MTTPICPVCKIKPCLFTKSKGYVEWCSPKCRSKHPAVEAKRQKTCLEKYGDITSARNINVKEKKANTCVERYGAISPTLNLEIRNKQLDAMLKKYNATSPQHATEIKQKIKNTLKQKYGTDNFGELKKVNPTIYKKSRTTEIENWLPQRIESFSDIAVPLYSLQEFNNVKTFLPYKCCRCDNIFEDNLINGSTPRCPKCYPHNNTNWEQQQIYEFVKSLNIECVLNERNLILPQEIDLFVPEKNIAIEYNGLYWHSEFGSEGRVDKNYHISKTKKCENKNVQLIHIFEDEWKNKRPIVESIIKNKFGVITNKIYARECVVKEVDSHTSLNFLDANHIQGKDKSTIRIGLFYKDEIVSLMTFSKPRFNKNIEYEMVRFCSKININVVGGASKLLTFFEKTYRPKSLITYADRRYSNGKTYEKLGFEFVRETSPSYFYVHIKTGCKQRYNRIQFQKHKLSKQLENFNPELSESENMKNNFYSKVWDCGTYVFVKNYN